MLRASSGAGCSTLTGWKRRSSAGSFSKYLEYSSKVVAPTVISLPRASRGLIRFARSGPDLSPPPAPSMLWISSMKSMTLPAFTAESSAPFSRSSKSPLYLVPASSAATSSENNRLPSSFSGTSPAAIACASPSATADFPTPASPTSTGLFLLLRQRICITRSISPSLPMTGSNSPLSALAVRSVPKGASASGRQPSYAAETTPCARLSAVLPLLRSFSVSSRAASGSTPAPLSISSASGLPSSAASICSVLISGLPSALDTFSASDSALRTGSETRQLRRAPVVSGTLAALAPRETSILPAVPAPHSPAIRCAMPMTPPLPAAYAAAASRASSALIENTAPLCASASRLAAFSRMAS